MSEAQAQSFNGLRLELARNRRGLTKKKLAEAIGVDTRAIAAYESGEYAPTTEKIRSIAETLRFPEAFFFVDSAPPELFERATEVDGGRGASFRALSSATASQKHAVFAMGKLAIELSQYLGAQLELPEPDLLDLREEESGFEPLQEADSSDDNMDTGRAEAVEAAATSLRAHWEIGNRPIQNMVHLLELHGVRVFSLVEDCSSIDAFAMWVNQTPYVFLNTMKSGERGRFDAAHELGHLVLHRHGSPQGRKAEIDANRFASAFLLPRESIVATAPRQPTVDRLLELKRTWKVSIAALVRRLYDLSMLTQWQYDRLCIELAQRGWRTKEPSPIERESSQLLPKAFSALEQDGMNRRDIARALCVPTEELSAMTFGLIGMPTSNGSTAGRSRKRPDLRLVR